MPVLRIAGLLALLILARPATAQTELAGAWVMTLTPPHGQPMTLDVEASIAQDSLRLTMPTNEGDPLMLEAVTFAERRLRFVVPSGHGRITCTLYQDEREDFSGICAGPMGEGATTLRRKKKP